MMNRDYPEIGVERKQTVEEHKAVLEAIFQRDALRAAEAMRHHMEMAHRRRFPEKEPEWL
jgi:DNA-binding GntR family transcriptional regulator